ncbi:hypothetical protein D3C81_1225000 [compost metagenome]
MAPKRFPTQLTYDSYRRDKGCSRFPTSKWPFSLPNASHSGPSIGPSIDLSPALPGFQNSLIGRTVKTERTPQEFSH